MSSKLTLNIGDLKNKKKSTKNLDISKIMYNGCQTIVNSNSRVESKYVLITTNPLLLLFVQRLYYMLTQILIFTIHITGVHPEFFKASFQARADLGGGARGAEAPPLQVYSTPVQSFARHWQLRSSVSVDNLCVMAMVEEGCMEAPVVAKRLGDGP